MTKDFRGSDAAAKAWLRGGFCLKLQFSRLNYPYKRDRTAVTVRPCNLRQNRRATGARIWGSVRSQTVRRKCYFLYTQTVNRTYFFDQLAYGKMTLLNFSFMFVWCGVISLSKTTNSTQFPQFTSAPYLYLSPQSCCLTADGISRRQGVSHKFVLN